MRTRPLLKTAALGFAVVGCGGETNRPLPMVKTSPERPAAVRPQPTTRDKSRSPVEKALQAFGKDLNERHIARIAMNTCIAWTNTEDKLTVTYNPGYIFLTKTTKKLGRTTASFFVWASEQVGKEEGYPHPALKVANSQPRFTANYGKTVIDGIKDTTLQIRYSHHHLQDNLSKRHVSHDLTEDPAGYQGFYTDEKTGQPVLRTRQVPGNLDIETIAPICESLRQGPLAA